MTKPTKLTQPIPPEVWDRLNAAVDLLGEIGANDFAHLPYWHVTRLAHAFDKIADTVLDLAELAAANNGGAVAAKAPCTNGQAPIGE